MVWLSAAALVDKAATSTSKNLTGLNNTWDKYFSPFYSTRQKKTKEIKRPWHPKKGRSTVTRHRTPSHPSFWFCTKMQLSLRFSSYHLSFLLFLVFLPSFCRLHFFFLTSSLILFDPSRNFGRSSFGRLGRSFLRLNECME